MLNINFYNLVFNIINILVLFLILKKFLIGPVTAILQKREEEIKSGYQEADQAKQQAQDMKEKYEASMKNTHEEAEQILKKARENARKEEERIISEAGQKAERIVSDAMKKVDADREKALSDVRSEIAGLAMTAVAQIMGEQSSANSDAKVYDQFIAKAGEANDTSSH